MRAAKVQASLRIRAVSPEPSLLAHISSESRGTFRQKARSVAPLNGWACAVEICHDGMLEDTNSLDGAHLLFLLTVFLSLKNRFRKKVFALHQAFLQQNKKIFFIKRGCLSINPLEYTAIQCFIFPNTYHVDDDPVIRQVSHIRPPLVSRSEWPRQRPDTQLNTHTSFNRCCGLHYN